MKTALGCSLLMLLLAGCGARPEGQTPPLPVIEAPGIGPVFKQWQGDFNVSLFGSWGVADTFYGHIDQDFGYNNCLSFGIQDAGLNFIRVVATWASRNPTEDELQLFHNFKSDNRPRHGLNVTSGPSPLDHAFQISPANGTDYLWVGIDPPAGPAPASFGTTDVVHLNVTLIYSGEATPIFRHPFTCGKV